MSIIAFFVILYIVLCFIGSVVYRLVRGQEKVVVYKYVGVTPEVEDWEVPEYEPMSMEEMRAQAQETIEWGRVRAEEMKKEAEVERMKDAGRLYPNGPAQYRIVEDGIEKVMVRGSDEYDEMYKLIREI